MNGLSSTTSPSILRAAFLVLARQQLLAPPPPAVPSPSPSPTPAPHLPWPQPALDALFSLQAKLIEARRELHEARSESTSTVAEPDGAPCHSAIMERAWKFKITKLEGELAAAKGAVASAAKPSFGVSVCRSFAKISIINSDHLLPAVIGARRPALAGEQDDHEQARKAARPRIGIRFDAAETISCKRFD